MKCHCHILSQSVLHGTSVTSLFAKVDFATLENFLAESELNCHEWELAQALRRWVIANEAEVKCHEEEDETETGAVDNFQDAIRRSVDLAKVVAAREVAVGCDRLITRVQGMQPLVRAVLVYILQKQFFLYAYSCCYSQSNHCIS